MSGGADGGIGKAKGTPTKEFFIEMLTKDIQLKRAILDLVDNSVDAARALRPGEGLHGANGGDRYRGLWVRIRISPDGFAIEDNCGGMSVAVARDQAFRFGRPKSVQGQPYSVGQFGIGMKRAIFKLGEQFTVESRTRGDWFRVEIDIAEWQQADASWDFDMASGGDLTHAPTGLCTGTRIVVTELHQNVAEEFGREAFVADLCDEIRMAHCASIAQGVQIFLNDETEAMEERVLTLLSSEDIRPVRSQVELEGAGGEKVDLALYAGLADAEDSRPSEAGWYVFCNDRLVLAADQTEDTGWGTAEGGKVVRYHNQYSLFRGYAFFEAKSAGVLPWNTTKTRVDVDSPVMKRARREMAKVMKPIIGCLNALDREKDVDEASRAITAACEAAKPVALQTLPYSESFGYPTPPEPAPEQRLVNIQYRRPEDQVRRVMEALEVGSYSDAGQSTFDLYYESECDV